MTKTVSSFLVALTCATLTAGCGVMAHGPVTGPIVIDQRGPVAAGTATGRSKVGRAQAHGILIFATGDASISAAMKNGGITRIHHVDSLTSNYFGVYATYETIVYGE